MYTPFEIELIPNLLCRACGDLVRFFPDIRRTCRWCSCQGILAAGGVRPELTGPATTVWDEVAPCSAVPLTAPYQPSTEELKLPGLDACAGPGASEPAGNGKSLVPPGENDWVGPPDPEIEARLDAFFAAIDAGE